MNRLQTAAMFALFGAGTLFAQPMPGGEEVLRKVEGGFASVNDYSVTLNIVADVERLKVPPMKVRMAFKKPDRVHFASEGFAMLPKESIGFTPSELLRRLEPENVRMDSLNGRRVFQVLAKVRKDRTGLRRLILDIDPERWTVERLTSPQFDGRTVTALFRYEKIENTWLPVRLEVSFVVPQQDTTAELPAGTPPTTPGPLPRTGRITVSYSDYQVNKGIADSLFEQEK